VAAKAPPQPSRVSPEGRLWWPRRQHRHPDTAPSTQYNPGGPTFGGHAGITATPGASPPPRRPTLAATWAPPPPRRPTLAVTWASSPLRRRRPRRRSAVARVATFPLRRVTNRPARRAAGATKTSRRDRSPAVVSKFCTPSDPFFATPARRSHPLEVLVVPETSFETSRC
jgi:hypothetical protein